MGYLVPMHSWFRSFLSDRSQLVAVHGVTSHPVPVFSGVPQGSVLGPILFFIYVNDLCLSNFTTNSSLVLYADDTTLYKPLSKPSDLSDFQVDINTIHNWLSSNQPTANAAKTKSMVISTKQDPFPDMILYPNNQPIEWVSSAKFLGIWITQNLSWNLQVDHICKKARRTIGFIHRAFHSAPVSTRCILYLALVRPILEYGTTTWHQLKKILTNRLESCQRFACRVVLQSWKASHEDLLSKSDLPLLSKRRDIATLCHLFKIVHDLCSSPNPFKPHPRPNLRNVNSCALDPPFCCLTLSQRSFYPYAPTLWNYLPRRKLSSASLCHLSRRLFIPILCNHRLSHLVLFSPV